MSERNRALLEKIMPSGRSKKASRRGRSASPVRRRPAKKTPALKKRAAKKAVGAERYVTIKGPLFKGFAWGEEVAPDFGSRPYAWFSQLTCPALDYTVQGPDPFGGLSIYSGSLAKYTVRGPLKLLDLSKPATIAALSAKAAGALPQVQWTYNRSAFMADEVNIEQVERGGTPLWEFAFPIVKGKVYRRANTETDALWMAWLCAQDYQGYFAPELLIPADFGGGTVEDKLHEEVAVCAAALDKLALTEVLSAQDPAQLQQLKRMETDCNALRGMLLDTLPKITKMQRRFAF